jgi:hypothetical protein
MQSGTLCVFRDSTCPDSYPLYLQGRYFHRVENNANFLKDNSYFEQTVEKDTDYSSAYIGLADTYMLLGLYSLFPRDEAAQKAKRTVRIMF